MILAAVLYQCPLELAFYVLQYSREERKQIVTWAQVLLIASYFKGEQHYWIETNWRNEFLQHKEKEKFHPEY